MSTFTLFMYLIYLWKRLNVWAFITSIVIYSDYGIWLGHTMHLVPFKRLNLGDLYFFLVDFSRFVNSLPWGFLSSIFSSMSLPGIRYSSFRYLGDYTFPLLRQYYSVKENFLQVALLISVSLSYRPSQINEVIWWFHDYFKHCYCYYYGSQVHWWINAY